MVSILIITGYFIEISESDNYEKVVIKLYQHLIRKLIYLSFGIRFNIVFAIGQLSNYNSNLRTSYMKAAKKVVRYLKIIIYIELVYESLFHIKVPTKPSLFGFNGYRNSSYTGDPKDKKSVMGY